MRPKTDQKVYTPNTGTEGRAERRKRLDLNAAQVAGSAVAAVVAAKLASKMGVYGTVLGAGVISVIATCGGSIFQHLLRSTAERVREFGGAATYATRVRGWKRSAIAAALVFGLAMVGITAYELISGQDLSGGRGTTITSVVRGGDSAPRPSPSPYRHQQHQERERHQRQTPGPGTGTGGDDGTPAPTPTTTPATPTPTPTPTPSTTDEPDTGATGGDQPSGSPQPSG
ncbi:hypothetical protein QWM81_00995 [Streptomyces ficellus]|uniref:Uncharacterized protein n=1 Tax=Streptomyces ficellus TaxID=1977088 RepID=A0ABT7YZH2_9ACTN|nr:hypothetical protein [Streptomyces ficellus]MDN3292641.1 hypothetical protein [Streptomyces ficellus]